ncbi:hypothetical protein L208DRAFT_1426731 [Tricholoma matsutake]|nr:hypothetical protein L208DRAFT_1426731 [Tricholoma matsutake 945]
MAQNGISRLREPSKLFYQQDITRQYIISAYWCIIVLALPLWWSTTSIERLSLPSSRVTSQARSHLRIPIRLNIDTEYNGRLLADRLKESIDGIVLKSPDRWKRLDIHVNHRQTNDDKDAYTIVDGTEGAVVRDGQLAYPLHSPILYQFTEIITSLILPLTTAEQDHRVAQYSPRYRLSFTLLNEDAAAGHSVSEWAVADAISRHISPILKRLSVLHNFTIESQVQFHAPLAFKPLPVDSAFGITSEDLTVFVNSAEWTLSSSTSNDPVLHFILFVPSTSHRPLYIMNHDGSTSSSNAFLLPQWGGIVILDLPEQDGSSAVELLSASLDPIFSTFSNHLLALLGVPHLPLGVNLFPGPRNHVLSDWQLDALIRRRTLENAYGSQETLRSIVKLVGQIENMPVGQDVLGDIHDALSALEKMHSSSNTSLIETFHHSSRAHTLSSRAFFNPGMLALLYFPAEHKYAVYTPLFASAVIPLIVAALREFKGWRNQQKERITSE